jgi:hypothetical protein
LVRRGAVLSAARCIQWLPLAMDAPITLGKGEGGGGMNQFEEMMKISDGGELGGNGGAAVIRQIPTKECELRCWE